MKKNRTKKPATSKKKLSAGEKFWEEYLATPYSNDRVGQAFVIPDRGKPPEHKKQSSENNQDEDQSTQDPSTQDPGLKFLEELDRMPYTYDRMGQVSVSSWKRRSFGPPSTKGKEEEDYDSNRDQTDNPSWDKMDTLINYDNPDHVVIAYLYDPDGEEISLEIGTDVHYETDDMSDDEIVDWATDNGYLGNEQEDCLKEDGTPDVAYLRSVRKGEEEDNLPAESTPSGRAYRFFKENCLECDADIKIELVDSFHPGDNSYGASVYGISSLLKLQEYLFTKRIKVNFSIREY